MRFVLKTNYGRDIDIFKHPTHAGWYVLLVGALLVAPFGLEVFYETQLTELFIWAIAGIGLMLLVGYTGLVSLGHAAFMALGAYTHAILYTKGLPYIGPLPLVVSIPLSAIITGGIGILVGIASLRMTGIYLAIATLAFAMIVEKVLAHWTGVTGGHFGFRVKDPEIFGFSVESATAYYYVCLVVLLLVFFAVINLLRSPTGRSFVAVRDSEISAQAMGVNLFQTKTLVFALSAGFTGLAGALYAHRIGFLFPETFTIVTSIKLLMLVVVGGLGSLHGVVFGSFFIAIVPQIISIVRDWLPTELAQRGGLEPLFFGGVLILFLIFEPLGIYGRWVKIRLFFSQFPLYRRKTFRRQKSYLKTERVH